MQAGKIAPGLLNEIEGTPRNQVDITPDQAQKYGLFGVFPQQEAGSMLEATKSALSYQLQPDWEHLPKGVAERQDAVTQIVQFSSWGKAIKLYNFTGSRLTAETVSKIAYAQYEMARRTGGNSFEMLEVMAVVPNTDPALVVETEEGKVYNRARTDGGAMLFAEAMINPEVPMPESTLKVPELHEPEDDAPFGVPGDIVQRTVFHELTHLITGKGKEGDLTLSDQLVTHIGWKWEGGKVDNTGKLQPVQKGWQKAPTCYGRANHLEDLTVSGEASFVGGAWFKRHYDAQRKEAVDKLFSERHSQRQGPTLVTATEIPLPMPAHKLGLPDQPTALVAEYSYAVF